MAIAQSPGAIITPATPVINPMNPNGDNFITSHNGNFSGPLDESEFELPFLSIHQYEPEPSEDNQASGGCSLMEMIGDPVTGAEASYYYYRDPDGISANGDEIIVFRFRLAKLSSDDRGYSVLMDIDGRFGFSGLEADPNAIVGNPGFEREVNVFHGPGATGRVKVFNVDGANSTPAVPLSDYSKNSNYQISKALNYDPDSSCDEVVFIDMWIPFSDLGISASTSIRMAAAANEDVGTALGGGATDISGIDGDDPSFYDDDDQFYAAIVGYPPLTFAPNTAPVAPDASVALNENSPNATVVHTVLATDADVLTYTLIGGNTGTTFSINSSSGVITVNNSASLNFETSSAFTLIVRVSDGTLFDDATITVNLNNVNETPAASDAIVSVDENKSNGSTVHAVSATDPDQPTVLNYSITAGNSSGAFAINPASGIITVNNSVALNFEATPNFALVVRVSDGTLFDDATITVNLNNVNETPAASDAIVSVDENKSNGSTVHALSASDPDQPTVLNYSITAGNSSGAFAINPASGIITVNNSVALNFEATPTFGLVVRVSDGILFDDATIMVNLNNVNEPPVATDATVTLDENKSNGGSVHNVAASDPDAVTALSYSITAGNSSGAFVINSVSGLITVNNSAALNFEATPTLALTVRVIDGVLFDDATITVNINNVNENPVASDATVSIDENRLNGSSVHTMDGSDPDAASVLNYSIIAGNANGAFAINSASGEITINNSKAIDFETTSVFSLTVRVSDGTLFDNATVTVILNDVSETPAASDATVSVDENTPNGSPVYAVNGRHPDMSAMLNYSIIGGNTNDAFTIDNTSGEITVNNSAALDFELTTVFTIAVRVSDGSLFGDAIITVKISDLNESPSVPDATVTMNEHELTGTRIYTVTGSDPDAASVLNYTIVASNLNAAFTVNSATGEITVNNSYAMDFETTPVFTLTVRVSDGFLFDDAIVTVSLDNVNEAPVAADAAVFVKENESNGVHLHTVTQSDPDASGVFTYSIIAGNSNGAFAIDVVSGEIDVNNSSALDFETITSFVLTVRVSEKDLFDDALVTVNLIDINEAPSISDEVVFVDENSTKSSLICTLVASDPDGSPLNYDITSANTSGAFSINNSSGEIRVNDPFMLDFESGANVALTVRVSDGSLADEAVILVNVRNVNETPRVNGANVRILANTPNGTIVHQIVAEDPDLGDLLTYSFESGNYRSAFSIDPDTGQIIINDNDLLKVSMNRSVDLYVRVQDRDGLFARALMVFEIDRGADAAITPLKGFSPDGDGTNDFWQINGIEAFPDNEVKVFNRWGMVVFETRNYNNNEIAWRGENISRGSEIPETTFFFIITVPDLLPITGYLIVKE